MNPERDYTVRARSDRRVTHTPLLLSQPYFNKNHNDAGSSSIRRLSSAVAPLLAHEGSKSR